MATNEFQRSDFNAFHIGKKRVKKVYSQILLTLLDLIKCKKSLLTVREALMAMKDDVGLM